MDGWYLSAHRRFGDMRHAYSGPSSVCTQFSDSGTILSSAMSISKPVGQVTSEPCRKGYVYLS